MSAARPSTEIRWFLKGALPDGVSAWFEAGGPLRRPEERVDRYLRFPGTADVGVKLRGGLLEIKARTGAPRPLVVAPSVAGHADSWVKRSLDVAFRDDGDGPEDWISVRKRRRARVFGLRPAGLGVGLEAEAGVSVELAELVVAKDAWWSVALETFGTSGPDFELLAAAARSAFAPPPPEPLPQSRSQSFPAWLEARTGAASAASSRP